MGKRGHEIPRREPVQVQQRQHLLNLRGLARPRRQDRRREPVPLTGFRVDTAVVDPRRVHRHRARAGGHLARFVVAVAHHQPPPVLVALIGESGAVGVHFGPQRLGQHPPRALPDEFVDQRRPRGCPSSRTVAVNSIRNYSEHGSYLPDQRYRAGLAWNLYSVTREGTPLPEPIHRFQALLRSSCTRPVEAGAVLADLVKRKVARPDNAALQQISHADLSADAAGGEPALDDQERNALARGVCGCDVGGASRTKLRGWPTGARGRCGRHACRTGRGGRRRAGCPWRHHGGAE